MATGGGSWQDDRTQTTYREARAVIESQNSTMADIDTKAMRTVRFNVLLVGVLLTAAQVIGPGAFREGPYVVAIGTLLASVVLGVVTYNESDLYVGVSEAYIEAVLDGRTENGRWDGYLLQTFAGMISENGDEIRWNSWLLTLTQSALVLGVLSGVASVLI